MKRRIINFGDIQLNGAVGEWGLVLTDLAGANGQDILLPFNQKIRVGRNGLMPFNPGSHFICSLLYRVDKEMHETECCGFFPSLQVNILN
jgi:hypothetical protein